jgi:sugar lactone lactonase YvrE
MSVFTSGGYVCQPRGLAFDDNGVLYVAVTNTCASAIIKVDSSGQQAVFVGAAGFPNGSPFDLAFDRSGNLYATSGNAIYKFDVSGNGTLFASEGLDGPSGLAFDSGGYLYAANLQSQTIQKFDSAGQGTLFAATRGNGNPYGIAFDTAGNLYVANGYSNTIQKFNSAGQGSVFGLGMGIPYAVAIQPTGIPTHTYISGNISYCSNPVPGPAQDVTLTVTGSATGSTLSDSAGSYQFSSLAAGGSYTVTPTKTALPGSPGIDTVDVVATQRHFLNIAPLPPGCRLTAADVNGDSSVDTVDVIAIQRFFLGLTTGIANVGKYQFSPMNRTYTGIVSDQTGQNYDTLVFGDVAAHFVELPDGPLPSAAVLLR